MQTQELNSIINQGFSDMLMDYALQYQKNPKNFIGCFFKFKTIRECCAWIVTVFRKDGSLEECKRSGKDFSDWVNKQPIEDKWKPVLGDTMLIIYNVINN